MRTTHRVRVGDARDATLPADSVELVVTSPPYPMVEMWDGDFAAADAGVETLLDAGDGDAAFDRMHAVLDDVWAEVSHALVPGGVACVVVGDATRSVGDRFRVFRNAARVGDAFEDLGFDPLPEVLWRKPTNSAAKFMGSGMVPPNAYVTLEHEHVLVFRNGPRRSFPAGDEDRYASAYFWEERNRWFSDVWTDVGGAAQDCAADARERSAAFPLEIPSRLVNMFSVRGDTVWDPFWGTGTTSLAAMLAGRHSLGTEREREFLAAFDERMADLPARSVCRAAERLADHREYVADARSRGQTFDYEADHYDVAVKTAQEREIALPVVDAVERVDGDSRIGDDRMAPSDAERSAAGPLPDPTRLYEVSHSVYDGVTDPDTGTCGRPARSE